MRLTTLILVAMPLSLISTASFACDVDKTCAMITKCMSDAKWGGQLQQDAKAKSGMQVGVDTSACAHEKLAGKNQGWDAETYDNYTSGCTNGNWQVMGTFASNGDCSHVPH